MGIRFYCPQGHKLNVKSFLAGKKGFCPHCNAKVDIPLASTRASSKATPGEAAEFDDVTSHVEAAQANLVDPFSDVTVGVGISDLPASSAQTAGGTSSVPDATGVSSSVPVAAMPIDPIAEAPDAVWYVRPRTGGQYGPTGGDDLRQWIDEGRVAADTYVWRDGWPTWRLASETFSKFQSPAAAPSGAPAVDSVGPGGDASSTLLPTAGGNAESLLDEATTGGVLEEPAVRPIRRLPMAPLVVLMSIVALVMIPVAIYFIFFR